MNDFQKSKLTEDEYKFCAELNDRLLTADIVTVAQRAAIIETSISGTKDTNCKETGFILLRPPTLEESLMMIDQFNRAYPVFCVNRPSIFHCFFFDVVSGEFPSWAYQKSCVNGKGDKERRFHLHNFYDRLY